MLVLSAVARRASAAARARSQAGSKTRVTYSLPPERDDGYRRGPSVMCATVPQGTVATTVRALSNVVASTSPSNRPGMETVMRLTPRPTTWKR